MYELAEPPFGFPFDAIVSFTEHHAFLGMDYPYLTQLGDNIWPTLEHAYQAARCDDPEYINRLKSCYERASCAKLIGQSCHNTSPQWYETRNDLLFNLLLARYHNKGMQDLLLLTGNQLLIYGNQSYDNYLGMVWYRTAEGYNSLHGENVLGKMHMQIRDMIRAGQL